MEIKQLINMINNIFERAEQSINLNHKSFEAAVIKKIPKADICRWKDREITKLNPILNDGILNREIVSREDFNLRNGNGQTHFAFNQEIEKMFSAIPFQSVFNQYSLAYPCDMLEGNLPLLLNNIPEQYYSEMRIQSLLNTYNKPEKIHHINLALSIEAQDRVMVSNKTSIIESDIPSEEKLFFFENRFAIFVDDYVVILKYKKQMKYLMLFLPRPSLNDEDIELIGTQKIQYAIEQQSFNTSHIYLTGGKNTLVFGAPGTGKSHYIKEQYEDNSISKRVVFHEEYSYQDFIGGIKPVITSDGVPKYKFNPGPFTRILKLALENRMTSYTLIIEELNRANAASVFGDTFQLLDRNEDGVSEYSIDNDDILDYLNTNTSNSYSEIIIPGNLNIVATMNSADQGVFPLDTAFKRRWNYEYMPIKFDAWHEDIVIPYLTENWENDGEVTLYINIKDYIETINTYLSNNDTLEVNEDRLIGPYYLKQYEWEVWETDKTYKKLLSYLWDDVARIDRGTIFKDGLTQFSHVCDAAEHKQQVFTEDLHRLLREKSMLMEELQDSDSRDDN